MTYNMTLLAQTASDPVTNDPVAFFLKPARCAARTRCAGDLLRREAACFP